MARWHTSWDNHNMSRRTLLILSAMSFLWFGFAQSGGGGTAKHVPLRTLNNTAFQVGEKLTYVVHYGWLNAGEAVVELKDTDMDAAGRPLIHAVGTGDALVHPTV